MTWQWLAGFYDGEGGAYFINDRSLRIDVSQSNLAVLKSIRHFVGYGSIYEKPMRHKKDGCRRKRGWQFTVSGDLAIRFGKILLRRIRHKEKIEQLRFALAAYSKYKNRS